MAESADVASATSHRPRRCPRARAVAGAPKKVLVVDDEPETAGGLAEILREDGLPRRHRALRRGRARALQSRHLPPAADRSSAAGQVRRRAHQARARRGAGDGDRAHHRARYGEDRSLGAQARRQRLHQKAGQPEEAARARADSARRAVPTTCRTRCSPVGRSGVVLFEGMMARSRVMHNVFEKIKLAAQSDATVLITGESGTGKELVARAIHMRSQARERPVRRRAHRRDPARAHRVASCSATSAARSPARSISKEGKFELADGGTIFLDEISTMDERTQINLLRVLESFAYMRIGGKKERQADVRVVAATNRDLIEDGGGERLPRGPLLPAEHPPDQPAAAARAARGRGAAGHRVHGARSPQHYRKPMQVDAGRDAAAARGLPLAGQRARAAQRHRAGGAAGARRAARSGALAADDLSRRSASRT